MTVNQFGDSGYAGFGIYAFDRAAMLAGAPAVVRVREPRCRAPADDVGDSVGPGRREPAAGRLAELRPSPSGSSFVDGSPDRRRARLEVPRGLRQPRQRDLRGSRRRADRVLRPARLRQPESRKGLRPAARLRPADPGEPNLLMYRLAYRNFGDHESLVTNFTVDGAATANRAAIRWFELRDPNGSPVDLPGGHVRARRRATASSARSPWIASGNIALGYSKSDATIHPSPRGDGAARRRPARDDGRGERLLRGPEQPAAGRRLLGALQLHGAWTPSDDCTFWFTAEYIGDPAPFFEYTRIGSFKFPSCTSGPSGVLAGNGDGGRLRAIRSPGARVTAGASETLTDAAGHYQFLTLPVGNVRHDGDQVRSTSRARRRASSSPTATRRRRTSCSPRRRRSLSERRRPRRIRRRTGRSTRGSRSRLPDFPGAKLFTDPVTGYYGITLVTGISYTIAVEAVTPGLRLDAAGRSRSALSAASVRSDRPELRADDRPDGLQRAGLRRRRPTDSPRTSTPASSLRAGPSSTTASAPGRSTPGRTAASSPGTRPAAAARSRSWTARCDGEASDDTELITPSVDLSADASAQVRFAPGLPGRRARSPTSTSRRTADSSGPTSSTRRPRRAGPNTQVVDITAVAAGQADVRARFHYYNAFNAPGGRWTTSCSARRAARRFRAGCSSATSSTPTPGQGLNGATVANLRTRAVRRPRASRRPTIPRSRTGSTSSSRRAAPSPFRATLDPYAPLTQSAVVIPNGARRLDFHLTAGRLDAAPRPLSARVDPGRDRRPDARPDQHGHDRRDLPDRRAQRPADRGARGARPVRGSRRCGAALLARDPARRCATRRARSGLAGAAGPAVRPRRSAAATSLNAYPTGLGHAWGVAFNTDAERLLALEQRASSAATTWTIAT